MSKYTELQHRGIFPDIIREKKRNMLVFRTSIRKMNKGNKKYYFYSIVQRHQLPVSKKEEWDIILRFITMCYKVILLGKVNLKLRLPDGSTFFKADDDNTPERNRLIRIH